MAASRPFQVLIPKRKRAEDNVVGFGGPFQVLIPSENAPRTVFWIWRVSRTFPGADSERKRA